MTLDIALPSLVSEGEWWMTVHGFYDESGKFKDKKVISIGGVASYKTDLDNFAQEWGRHLRANGLAVLSAKKVFNPRRPLSRRNTDVGIEKRIQALHPFVSCIRKHLQVVTGVAIDAQAFNNLPPHFFQFYGRDPSYMAFVSNLLELIGYTPQRDKIVLVFDEDEETTIPFYHLYKRVKKLWPGARGKLAAISFADDRLLLGLQAADLIGGLVRLEIDRRLNRTPYDYRELYHALAKPPERHERVWSVAVAIGDKAVLKDMAKGVKQEWLRITK